MIKFEKYSIEDNTIHYTNTTDKILTVRIEVFEGYTKSLLFENQIDLHPGYFYYTYIPFPLENIRIYFYNTITNELIAPFVVDGIMSLEEIDRENYLRKIQSKNNRLHQMGVNGVIKEHLLERKYRNIVDVEYGDIVFDIGFNYGIFSLGALNKGAKKIYGFEPNKYIFDKLSIYPDKDKVTIYNNAVSKENKLVTFYDRGDTLASSTSNNYDYFDEKYDVQSINIFDFILQNNIEKIDFLKVDCEGSEYEIFESIPDEYFSKIRKIHVEFHDNNRYNVQGLINKLERNHFEWEIESEKDINSSVALIFAKKKLTKRPRVTIVVPCFGRPQRTLRMLECIKNQTIDDFELFFIGDGCYDFESMSKTSTFIETINNLKSRGVIVHTFNMDKNHGGWGYNIINYALNNAIGKYFIFASNDDLLEPNHLEHYLSEIENTDYDMVCYSSFLKPRNSVRIPNLVGGEIGHSEIIVKTEVAKLAKPHKPKYGHDWDFIKFFLDNNYKIKMSENIDTQTYVIMAFGGWGIQSEIID